MYKQTFMIMIMIKSNACAVVCVCVCVCVCQEEATSYTRMSRYLEHLLRGTAMTSDVSSQQQQQPGDNDDDDDVFESLCEVIASDAQQSDIADELRSELRAERGQLVVDDYIRKEVRLTMDP